MSFIVGLFVFTALIGSLDAKLPWPISKSS